MASNINPNNIDAEYPVAGQDNDSQGFRTNFTNIKNNFDNAKDEINDLQSKAILKSALTGGTLNNDMAGTVLQSAEIKDTRETLVDKLTTNGAVAIDFSAGHNNKVTTDGSISLSFTNFPATGKVGRVRLEVTVGNVAHTLTLPSTVSKGVTGIAGYSSNVITFAETGSYLFEFWTDDNGTTIHLEDKSRPRDYFHSEQITLQQRTPSDANGAAGDVDGMIAVDDNYIYFCTGTYDGSTAIWKRVAGSTW